MYVKGKILKQIIYLREFLKIDTCFYSLFSPSFSLSLPPSLSLSLPSLPPTLSLSVWMGEGGKESR